MRAKKLLMFAPISVLALATSCGAAKRYNCEDYHIDLTWGNDKTFRILQLSDLHIGNTSDKDLHFKFIRKTLEMANNKAYSKVDNKVDLIVVTGDLFTFAQRKDAVKLFEFFDTLETPWTVTFGNHDEQCYFPVDWLTGYLNELNTKRTQGKSYCVFKDLQDDDVFGNANFVINLKDSDNNLKEQLYIFDSNRYNYGEYLGYDYIHYDQIDWYDRQIAYQKTMKPGTAVPSMAFFHIPFEEFEKYYQVALNKSGGASFLTDEDEKELNRHDSGSTGDPKKNTHLYDHFLDGGTNGVFVGHNHTSDYCVKVNANDDREINLCFGVKSTTNVYCETDLLGGQVITVYNKDEGKGIKQGDFTIRHFLHTYEDLK